MIKKASFLSSVTLALGSVVCLTSGCVQSSAEDSSTASVSSDLNIGGCNFDIPEALLPSAPIDPDCTDNPRPRMCSMMVQQVRNQIANVHNTFLQPNVDAMLNFYQPGAIVHAQGAYWRGTAQIRQLFTGLFQIAAKADLDFSTLHYTAPSPFTVVAYGDVSGTIYFLNGQTVPQDALSEMHTWQCNPLAGPNDRGFRIIGQHE